MMMNKLYTGLAALVLGMGCGYTKKDFLDKKAELKVQYEQELTKHLQEERREAKLACEAMTTELLQKATEAYEAEVNKLRDAKPVEQSSEATLSTVEGSAQIIPDEKSEKVEPKPVTIHTKKKKGADLLVSRLIKMMIQDGYLPFEEHYDNGVISVRIPGSCSGIRPLARNGEKYHCISSHKELTYYLPNHFYTLESTIMYSNPKEEYVEEKQPSNCYRPTYHEGPVRVYRDVYGQVHGYWEGREIEGELRCDPETRQVKNREYRELSEYILFEGEYDSLTDGPIQLTSLEFLSFKKGHTPRETKWGDPLPDEFPDLDELPKQQAMVYRRKFDKNVRKIYAQVTEAMNVPSHLGR